MKIGIVTFFFTNNYGGVIQAFALQEALKALGHDVEFVNFNPKAPKTSPIRAVARSIKRSLLSLFYVRTRFDLKVTKFARAYLLLGKRCKAYTDLDAIASTYDMIVVGSDQVWNTRLNGEHIGYYLLEFAHNQGIKTASYGSCIGQPEQEARLTDRFASNINKLSSISVRNQFSKDFIAQFSDRDISIVVDPTFLVDLSSHALSYPLRNKGDFVLVYCLNESLSGLVRNVLNEVLKSSGLGIVILHSKYRIQVDRDAEEVYDATPNQWLWFFGAANFVVTDSFHGMVFALKNEKRFCALHDNGWRSFRIKDLAEQLGLDPVCVYNQDQIASATRYDIDYSKVRQKLTLLLKNSNGFLASTMGIAE
jgi:polysaccharide pyruvyl transferase WcaK-like protein